MNIDPKKKSSSTSLSLQHFFFSIFSGGFWQVFVRPHMHAFDLEIVRQHFLPTFPHQTSMSQMYTSDVHNGTCEIPTPSHTSFYMMHGWTVT